MGHPLVGPAGRLLRELVLEAEIVEDEVYVTNAVEHFKWLPSGKRRIHDKPNEQAPDFRPVLEIARAHRTRTAALSIRPQEDLERRRTRHP